MGGANFEIPVTLGQPPPGGFTAEPDEHSREVPTPGLADSLLESLLAWVGRIPNPNQATADALCYLQEIRPNVTVVLSRECGSNDPLEPWVRLDFSGCAGMADVVSQLCAHWSESWFSQQREDILKRLASHGCAFDASRKMTRWDDDACYVPTETVGYIKPWVYEGSRSFEIDASYLQENEKQIRRALAACLPDVPYPHSCHCQICDPDFDPLPV